MVRRSNPLAAWVSAQPPWSDMPFVVLTNHNEGAEFSQFRSDACSQAAKHCVP